MSTAAKMAHDQRTGKTHQELVESFKDAKNRGDALRRVLRGALAGPGASVPLVSRLRGYVYTAPTGGTLTCWAQLAQQGPKKDLDWKKGPECGALQAHHTRHVGSGSQGKRGHSTQSYLYWKAIAELGREDWVASPFYSASHLCNHGWCCNPEHVCVELSGVNLDRNGCDVISCAHTPKCLLPHEFYEDAAASSSVPTSVGIAFPPMVNARPFVFKKRMFRGLGYEKKEVKRMIKKGKNMLQNMPCIPWPPKVAVVAPVVTTTGATAAPELEEDEGIKQQRKRKRSESLGVIDLR